VDPLGVGQKGAVSGIRDKEGGLDMMPLQGRLLGVVEEEEPQLGEGVVLDRLDNHRPRLPDPVDACDLGSGGAQEVVPR
jgi:hypothetical protein